jgi:hypothetical protein
VFGDFVFEHEGMGLEVIRVRWVQVHGGVIGVEVVAGVEGKEMQRVGVRVGNGPELLCDGVDGIEEQAYVQSLLDHRLV